MILRRFTLNRKNTGLIAGTAGNRHLSGVDTLGLLDEKPQLRKDFRQIVPFRTGPLVIPCHQPYNIVSFELV